MSATQTSKNAVRIQIRMAFEIDNGSSTTHTCTHTQRKKHTPTAYIGYRKRTPHSLTYVITRILTFSPKAEVTHITRLQEGLENTDLTHQESALSS